MNTSALRSHAGRGQMPRVLDDLPALAAARWGERRALVTPAGTYTFQDLDQRIDRMAGALARRDLAAGDRVVLHLFNGLEWITAYFAIARLGAVVVPANALLAPDEVRYIAEDCQAAGLIAAADRLEAIGRPQWPGAPRVRIAVGGSSAGCVEWDALADERGAAPPAHIGATPDDLATLGYTSGTTGRPKGALLTHRAIVTNVAMTALMHARSADDVIVSALPCSHVYGNVVMNGAFLVGYTLVLMRRFDADSALDAIERHRATMFEGVPTMYYGLLGASSLSDARVRTLTRCTVGGQTMPLPQMQEVEQRLGCPLLELGGMTELAGLGTTHPYHVPGRLGSIGQPLPFNECRIVALDDATRVLGHDEPGELMIRGPSVMRGYHAQPEATAEALTAEGWLHSGDIARRDADGYLWIVDRKKEMVLSGGYNVYPSELERVIASHPSVAVVAVGGVADARLGEAAHAFIVLRPGSTASATELEAYCRERLATYKLPRAFHFVTDLPKTSTGKIVRRALKDVVPATP